MELAKKPTIGLALSGGGNSSSFYIGFLEVLDENNLEPSYIAACSGGSLVAAAYACGTLEQFKQKVLGLEKKSLKTYLVRSNSRGGLYSLDLVEEEMRNFTLGHSFEQVRPLMGFVAVDIETGEKVVLCMGDIAKAARISCTLPGVFEPIKWGGKTLVDGGLLTMVPGEALRLANMDITVGINMRGTRHIFSDRFISGKKVYNFFKKILFVKAIESFLNSFSEFEDLDLTQKPGIFSVIGKSLDLAIAANKIDFQTGENCDLMITPNTPSLKTWEFTPQSLRLDYECGRATALQYLPEITRLLEAKKVLV